MKSNPTSRWIRKVSSQPILKSEQTTKYGTSFKNYIQKSLKTGSFKMKSKQNIWYQHTKLYTRDDYYELWRQKLGMQRFSPKGQSND